MSSVQPIPDGYSRVSPYLCLAGGAKAIDFYAEVFGASERLRLEGPDGRIGHAELQIGDSVVMLADEWPEMGFEGPNDGSSGVMISVYVEDVDAAFERAIAAGSKELRAPEDQFYGDRNAQFVDPFGHRWSIASRVEDVTEDEVNRRFREAMRG